MIKPVLLLVTILITNLVYTQDNFNGHITWGAPIDLEKGAWGPDPIGVTNGTFYATKRIKKKVFLMKYDANTLKIKSTSEIVMLYKNQKINASRYFMYGDKVMMASSYKNKKEKTFVHYLHELNEDGSFGKTIELAKFSLVKVPKVVITQKQMETYLNSSVFSFNSIISEDKKSLLVYYKSEKQNDENTVAITTLLFDENLEEKANSEMILPFKNAVVGASKLSNTGIFQAVGFDLVEDDNSKKKKITYTANDYFLFTYDPIESQLESSSIDIDKDISNISLKVFEDESVVVFGLYSNEESNGVNGAFFIKINPSGNIDFSNLDEFEFDFITKNMTEKQKAKAEKNEKDPDKEDAGLQNYYLHDLVLKENGEYVIFAEQYRMYVTSHTTYVNGKASTTYTYHYIYGDIIATSCKANGDLGSRQLISKYQHSTNDGGFYSSFFTLTEGNTIHLIFNGREAEMDDAEEAVSKKEKKKAQRKTVAALVSIDETGEITKKALFKFEGDESRRLAPKQCEKIGTGEVFLYTVMDRNTRVLGKMQLD